MGRTGTDAQEGVGTGQDLLVLVDHDLPLAVDLLQVDVIFLALAILAVVMNLGAALTYRKRS